MSHVKCPNWKIVSISLRDCCKIVEKISRVICPNCKIVPRLLQDCCKIVENIHMCYVYSNNISWIPDAVEYILIYYCSKGVFRKGSFINHVYMTGRRGVCQMSILLHKPYLVKWFTKGRGGQNVQKLSTWFMNDPLDLKYINSREMIASVCFAFQIKFVGSFLEEIWVGAASFFS